MLLSSDQGQEKTSGSNKKIWDKKTASCRN